MDFSRSFEDDVVQVSKKSITTTKCTEFEHKDLHIQSQRIILNIYECLKKENSLQSENSYITRIFELTKIPHTTIYRVIKQGDVIDHTIKRKKAQQNLATIDNFSKDFIRRTIYNFYKENKVPTLEMIFHKLQEYDEYKYKSLETLRNILLKCGFKHKKLDTRMIIMESSRIVILRQNYLREIKKYRELNRNIVYLDETWFDTHDTVKYGWVDDSKKCVLNTPCSRGKRIIILHAGNENGFVPNALLLSAKNVKDSSADYHQDMNAELFEKWLTEQLVPNIPPNSVIVLDNASYHSRKLIKIPNMNTKKADILTFLKERKITVPQKTPVKKELIKIIKSQNFQQEYAIDNFCRQKGHTILRLPPYYCIFNPIELLWSSIKSRLRKTNQSPTLDTLVLNNIRSVINDPSNKEIWKNSMSHVICKESEYHVLPPLNQIIIQPNIDSSSDEFSDNN